MISGPIAALRALPTRTLADLAQALQDGRLTGAATAFMVRYAVPAVGVTAAAELSSLLASGLGPQHAALLLDALAAVETYRHELPNDAPSYLEAVEPRLIRDDDVVLR